MILRRLSQSLREQNWTAIWIEFVLLVVGVFLGIQVANWNEERVTNKQSGIFTERLRDDLRVEVWRFTALNLYYDDVVINTKRTLDTLEGRSTQSNEALLISAYRATQYSEFIQYRATFDELTSTGNIGLIKDPSLRKMAAEIYSTKLFENVKNEGINSQYRVAFRMLVPFSVQEAIANKCGDRPAEIGNYDGIKIPLDYKCTTGLSQQDIDHAAQILRAHSELAPLLRLRLANIYSATSVQLMSQDVQKSLRSREKL